MGSICRFLFIIERRNRIRVVNNATSARPPIRTMGGWGDHGVDVRVNGIVKVEIPATSVVVRRDDHCMCIIAKLVDIQECSH